MAFLDKILEKKDEPVNTYEEFWKWFSKEAKGFHRVIQSKERVLEDFINPMREKLSELGNQYYILVGMLDEHTADLVISAEGVVKGVVFVEELINSAPAIEGWQFTALKPALDIKDVNISMDGYEFVSAKINFYSNDNPDYPDEIDITVTHDDLNEENRDIIINGLYLYLDNYLGELDFINKIDQLTVKPPAEAERDLIPIYKLKDFLHWRMKEFVEKYEEVKYDNEDETFTLLEASLEDEYPIIAMVNTEALKWENKASHPWIAVLNIKYPGVNENGLPDEEVLNELGKIEEQLLESLKNNDGYIYMGRQTAKNERDIFFACREFRKPSKAFYKAEQKYQHVWEVNSRIYKDKYWQTFERFNVTE